MIGNRIQKIAIVGGTFDPIHLGHLKIITEVAKKFEKVIVIPTGEPWLKANKPIATGEQRVAMVQTAVNSLNLADQVVVSAIEVKRSGPSYAIDTVTELKKIYPQANFTLVLGSDAAKNLHKWHRSEELQKLIEVLVVKRASVPPSDFPEIAIDAPEISSTEIRDKVAHSQEISDLVIPTISTFIKEHQLYGSQR